MQELIVSAIVILWLQLSTGVFVLGGLYGKPSMMALGYVGIVGWMGLIYFLRY